MLRWRREDVRVRGLPRAKDEVSPLGPAGGYDSSIS